MIACVETPVGWLSVTEADGAITEVDWGRHEDGVSPVLEAACAQISAYFEGALRVFDVPLKPRGSEFQQRFYETLCAIPFGETRTYGEIAADLKVSAQAIGQACGANPIPILIPCHRVLGAQGLGGYSGAGGVEAKVALLKLEGAASLLL